MYKTILVPTDFSEAGAVAWDHAVAMAKCNDSRIILLYVVEPLLSHYGVVGLVPGVKELEEKHDIASRLKLKEQVQAAEEAGLNITSRIASGKPWRCVVDVAKEEGAGLIVMGTHGRSGLVHDSIGSTAERVVQRACCPVLVVPPIR
jgi:nucleotide-binding universal stress UspA family protein